MTERIYLYDTRPREGGWTQGVDFAVADQVAIAAVLDQLGIDDVGGEWPGKMGRQRTSDRACG
jgi:2-isopropylmalate synthase